MCNEAARLRSLGEIAADFSELKIPLRFPEGLPNLGAAPSIRITDTAAIVRASRDGSVRASRDGIVRAAPGGDAIAELVQRRWSWLGAAAAGRAGKPVYNYRSEGREFRNGPTQGRCLIPLDGFYEFTDPGTFADVAGADGVAADGVAAGTETALSLPLPKQSASPAGGVGKATTATRAKKTKWLFALSPDAGPAWNPAGRAAPGLLAVAGLWRSSVDLGKAGTGEAFTMLTCAPGPDIAPYHSRQIVLMPRDRWADWLAGEVPSADLIAPTPTEMLRVERVA